MTGALAGLRVLDLSDTVAGQFCCRMMADFGATVTLVEPPEGSAVRRIGPFDPPPGDLGSLLFFHLNCGKDSVTLDLRTPDGIARLGVLARAADVIVVGLGADRAGLAAANPSAVIALVSDFGDDGPYRDWRGSEMIFQALSGMMYANGSAEREPLYGVGHRASYAAGVGAYIAVLAALFARKRIGRGQEVAVDIAMNTACMAPPSALEFAYSGLHDARGDRRSPFCAVECRDGWVSLWVHLHTWPGLCAALEMPELASDPRFAKGKERQDNWPALVAIVQARVRDWSSEDFLARLHKARLAAARAYTPTQLLDECPHLAARGYWESVSTGSGPRPILGPQFRMSATPRKVMGPAPAPGQHNATAPAASQRRAARAVTSGGPATAGSDLSNGPLSGLRVLEFTTAWAGPMAGRILAFLGAEVVHVESATRPDVWRGHNAVPQAKRIAGGVHAERLYNRNALFNSQNINKHSLSLDIKTAQGRAAMMRLAASADAVICNFTAGTLARMGFGYEALRKVRPDIVVAEMPGFGNTGPLADCTANGATMEMAAGMCALIGYPGAPPTTTGQVYPDPMGGYNGAAAVMTALLHRQSTGEGQYIEVPQVEAAMQFIGEELLYAAARGQDRVRHGNRVDWAAPHDAYPAHGADQWIAIAVESDAEWAVLCGMMERAELAADPRFATFAARSANQDLLRAPISDFTQAHDKSALAARLQAAGIRAAPVLGPGDLAANAYLNARHAFDTLTHPEAGTHGYLTLPFRLSLTPGAQRSASPCLGADTREVLIRMAGLSPDEVDELDRIGATSANPAA
jgi:crotonobetainyl-CoA:carnitine CoA-transferase CaiB-like acyl-CoA transferase